MEQDVFNQEITNLVADLQKLIVLGRTITKPDVLPAVKGYISSGSKLYSERNVLPIFTEHVSVFQATETIIQQRVLLLDILNKVEKELFESFQEILSCFFLTEEVNDAVWEEVNDAVWEEVIEKVRCINQRRKELETQLIKNCDFSFWMTFLTDLLNCIDQSVKNKEKNNEK